MKYLLAILLLFNTLYCHASVYTQTDSDGSAVYSDVPLSTKSEQIDVPEATEMQVITTESTTPPEQAIQSTSKKPYTIFEISSPLDKETIQNQPIITIKIKIEPQLQKGDKVQVYLDGIPQGLPAARAYFDLNLIERGEHQVSATLFDENNKSLKQAGPITIYVHRASVNQPSNQQAAR
jgi:hypothetical protein